MCGFFNLNPSSNVVLILCICSPVLIRQMLRTAIADRHLECLQCLLHMKSKLSNLIRYCYMEEIILLMHQPHKDSQLFYHDDAFSVNKINICKKAIRV
jgi:hypothetical protein